VMGRVDKVEITFYSSGGCESSCSERVAGDSCVDSILWFQLRGEAMERSIVER
jgi:hypothetical protein